MTAPASPGPAREPGSGQPLGETRAAGEGVEDDEMTKQVARQTSSDLQAEPVFEREAGGAVSDRPASDVDADELRDG
jgi:hypothetical protein